MISFCLDKTFKFEFIEGPQHLPSTKQWKQEKKKYPNNQPTTYQWGTLVMTFLTITNRDESKSQRGKSHVAGWLLNRRNEGNWEITPKGSTWHGKKKQESSWLINRTSNATIQMRSDPCNVRSQILLKLFPNFFSLVNYIPEKLLLFLWEYILLI